MKREARRNRYIVLTTKRETARARSRREENKVDTERSASLRPKWMGRTGLIPPGRGTIVTCPLGG
jgi:hypothetical protein